MKLKQLMLAPVALGMVAPVAANAADLNMAAVNQYSSEQATSVTQFTDVKPTDWAYQALGNLIEKYGCIAGMTDSKFAGGQTLTRFLRTAAQPRPRPTLKSLNGQRYRQSQSICKSSLLNSSLNHPISPSPSTDRQNNVLKIVP